MMPRALVLIDTEDGFRQGIAAYVDHVPSLFRLIYVTPQVRLEDETLVADLLRRVREDIPSDCQIGGFFVDLVVREEGTAYGQGKNTYDRLGVKIALALRDRYPATPVFIVTNKYASVQEQVLVSEASLEDVHGVLMKEYLVGPGLDFERLDATLAKGLAKIGGAQHPVRSVLRAGGGAGGRGSEGLGDLTVVGARVVFDDAVQRLGRGLGGLIRDLVGEAKGTIQLLQPGRSGATVFLVKAKAVMPGTTLTASPKGWVVKVAQDRELIKKEIDNCQSLKLTKLAASSYPQLLRDTPAERENLFGVAMSFEGGAIVLRDRLSGISSRTAASGLGGSVVETLASLYSDGRARNEPLWRQYWPRGEDTALLREKLLSELADTRKAAQERGVGRAAERVRRFVESDGGSCSAFAETAVDQWEERWIHGDLNSGNLLVSTGRRPVVVLIDFASAGPGHLAKDAAKLERDVLFRVCDNGGSAFGDWSRMGAWQRFASALGVGLESRGRPLAAHLPLLDFILELRNGLTRMNSSVGVIEYMMGLVFFSLTGLLIPELSIQKKVFGIWYVSELLEQAGRCRAARLADWKAMGRGRKAEIERRGARGRGR